MVYLSNTRYTDKEWVRKVSLEVEQQRVKLSDVGPPSFPPPPPPQDSSALPPQDHMYETPPALMQAKPPQDSSQRHDKKQATTCKPPVPAPSGEKLKDDWIPGYDVVSNPQKDKSAKCSPTASNVWTPDSPLKNSPPEETAQLSPSMQLKRDDRTKACRSTVIVRPPHLYEAVPDDLFEGAPDECARPKTIVVPRRSHIYESPDEVRRKTRKKPPPRKRPPPPPPPANVTTPTKTDLVEQVDSHVPTTPAQPKPNANTTLTSPVVEIVSNPISYLGTDLGGKRLTVDFQYDVKDDEKETREPKFLFNKGHSSSFIRVSLFYCV